MKFSRFTNIIKKNSEYEEEIEEKVEEFYNIIGIKGDMTKLIKEIGHKLKILVIQIPMRMETIGAVSYKTSFSKYILLNSNQPSCKMYFYFYHEIYHVLNGTTNIVNEQKEVHFNEDYFYDDNECKANLFAANILMPKIEFKNIYKIYKEDETDLKVIIFKLMNYFDAPYVAVLLRLFELKLLVNVKGMEKYLEYSECDLFNEFNKNGISDEILKPTLSNDSVFLYNRLENDSRNLIDKGLLGEIKYKRIIERIKIFIKDISIDGKDI